MKVRTSLIFPLAAVALLAANFNTSAQTWETILDKGSLTGTLEGQCIDPMSTASPALPNLFTGGLGDNGNVLLLNQSPSSYFVGDAAKGRSFQVAEVPIGSSRLYSVGSLFGGNPSSSWQVRRSTDGGSTWSTTDLYALAVGVNATASGVASDGAGAVYVVGTGVEAAGYEHWVVRRSVNNGISFTTFLDLSSRRAHCAANGALYVPGKGLFVVGRVVNKWTVQRQQNAGSSFVTVDSWIAAKGGASLATGIAADGQGNIFVCGATGTHWEPRSWVVRKSSDGGATWTTILDRWALGLLGTAESVALDPAGNVWLAGWHKADSFATYIWTVARLDKLNSWARTYDQPNLGNGLPHGITSDANGNVYVTGSLKADANSNGRWVVQRLLFP